MNYTNQAETRPPPESNKSFVEVLRQCFDQPSSFFGPSEPTAEPPRNRNHTLSVVCRAIALNHLKRLEETREKEQSKWLSTCHFAWTLVQNDIERLCPGIKDEVRKNVEFELRVIIDRILRSKTSTSNVNMKMVGALFTSQVERHVSAVLNHGQAFELSSGCHNPRDKTGKLLPTYFDIESKETKPSHQAHSKSFTLAIDLRSVDPTDPKEDRNGAINTGKNEKTHNRAHITGGPVGSGEEVDESGRVRWAGPCPGVLLVDSYSWSCFERRKSSYCSTQEWFVTQERVKGFLVGDVCFSFSNCEDRDSTFTRWVEVKLVGKTPALVKEARSIIDKKKAAGKSHRGFKATLERLQKNYVKSLWNSILPMCRAVDEQVAHVFRKNGRIYGPHTSFPSELRQYLRVIHDGKLEPLVEVDLSSCYHAILASMSREASLIADVQAGKLYDRIHETAVEMGFEGSVTDVKKEVNKHVLFNHGRRGWRSHVLWKAFRKLYPLTAQLVCNLRKGQPFGPSVLYAILTGRECAIMIERVLPRLHDLGIPALNLHDAVLVPISEEDRVTRIVKEIATAVLGFDARVSSKSCLPKPDKPNDQPATPQLTAAA